METPARLGESGRLALLSISLSSWIEGSAQLRSAFFMAMADLSPSTATEYPNSPDWRVNLIQWLVRSSRELDNSERAGLALLELATSLGLLRLLNIKPLLPFLLTPLSATVPVPSTFNSRSLKAVSWTKVTATVFALTLLQELNKVTCLTLLQSWRKQRSLQRKKALGKIVARGEEVKLPLDEFEEEEMECLICSGLGTDDPMAQSVSSLTSMETGAEMSARHGADLADQFGPLEMFCTTAPSKHLAHRECFLRWVESYRQQHQRVFLEPVTVEFRNRQEGTSRMLRWAREERHRIKAMLYAARFEHVLPSLIYSTPRPEQPFSRAPPFAPGSSHLLEGTSSRPRSVLLVETDEAGPSISSHGRTLATLQTSSPSCPACRSAVRIVFAQTPLNPPRTMSEPASLYLALIRYLVRIRKICRLLGKSWRKELLLTVTGRSLFLRLAAQYSFLFVLVQMIRATGRGKPRK